MTVTMGRSPFVQGIFYSSHDDRNILLYLHLLILIHKLFKFGLNFPSAIIYVHRLFVMD